MEASENKLNNTIENKTLPYERALYNVSNTLIKGCRFAGEEDGESALKECRNIIVEDCYMDLRYPMWHDNDLSIDKCDLTVNCRAALWYSNKVNVTQSKLHGIKAFRECSEIDIDKCDIVSPEFCWRCRDIKVSNSSLTGEYAFFESENIAISHLEFNGKYSFQYVNNMTIENSRLHTKDAFWHTSNVTVKDSVLEGEYLGWYSQGLTLIRCHIKGTQPLCYCKNLTLIDCTMEDTDLSFEYSYVDATVKSNIVSVKNPISGKITADNIEQLILEGSRYDCNAVIISGGKTIFPVNS